MSNIYNTKVYAKSSSKILPWKKMIEPGYHTSNGIHVKVDNSNYIVITTNHSIPYNSKKIFSVSKFRDSEYLNKLILKNRSEISDLALLEYGTIRRNINKIAFNDISELKYLTLNKFSKKIPKENVELTLFLDDNTELKLNFDKFGLQKLNGSNQIPMTPVLSCFLSKELENYNLNGLSGSPVFLKKRIVGLISNFDLENNRINLTPSFLILRFIENFLSQKYDRFKKNINEKINFIKIDAIPTENGLMLNSDYSNKIKKGNIITRIDHKILDNNCCVYSQEIKHRIPWDTYIMTLFKEDKISITFKDKTSFNSKLTVKDLNKYMKIDNNFKSEYFIIKGYVFCELNLPLINYFFTKKILLDGPSIRRINTNNFNNFKKKEIVLIDYIGKSKDDVFKGSITKIFDCKDYNAQNILSLKKFNNERVKDIQHLDKLLRLPNKTFNLHLEYNNDSILKLEL